MLGNKNESFNSCCCRYSLYVKGHLLNNNCKVTETSTFRSVCPSNTHMDPKATPNLITTRVPGVPSPFWRICGYIAQVLSHIIYTEQLLKILQNGMQNAYLPLSILLLFFIFKKWIPFSHVCPLTSQPQLLKKRCSSLTVSLCSLAHSRAPMYRPSNCSII